jgi:hypothetical protein
MDMDDLHGTYSIGFDRHAVEAITHALRTRAYYMWLEHGRPDGTALDHWCRAEDELALHSL